MSDKTTIMTTALGTAGGLAGFVLVFLGVVIAHLQSFDGATGKKILAKYERPAALALAAFLLCILSVVLSFTWLLTQGSECLYKAAVGAFFLALLSVLVIAVVVVRRIVWGK